MTFYGILWHFMAFYGILWHFMAIAKAFIMPSRKPLLGFD
jgi:hypothetical protein